MAAPDDRSLHLYGDVVLCVLRALDVHDARAAAASCKAWADAWRNDTVNREGYLASQVTLPRVVRWRAFSPCPGSLSGEAEYHRQACIPTAGAHSGVRFVRCPGPMCTFLGVEALCTLPDGRICACIGDGVTVFSKEMDIVARITDAGHESRPGYGLRNATAIATDGTALYVVDTSLGSIFRYSLSDFRLLRSGPPRSGPLNGLYQGDCERGHHIAAGGGRIYFTAGVHRWRDEYPETSVVHVLDAETLEVLRTFPTLMKNTQPDEDDVSGRVSDCAPGAVALCGDELFLVDESDNSALIQVFHVDGTPLRSIYPPPGAYYDWDENGDYPEDGRPAVWRQISGPSSICVANGQIYAVIGEHTVDCDPEHDGASNEDCYATGLLVLSLDGRWLQLRLLEDDSEFHLEKLKRLGVEEPRCVEWSIAPGPSGTLLLAESRHADEPPGAKGFCGNEGTIHMLHFETRRVHWHQCVHDSVALRPSAKSMLAHGLNRAVSRLVVLLLKKSYQQLGASEGLRQLHRFAFWMEVMHSGRSGLDPRRLRAARGAGVVWNDILSALNETM